MGSGTLNDHVVVVAPDVARTAFRVIRTQVVVLVCSHKPVTSLRIANAHGRHRSVVGGATMCRHGRGDPVQLRGGVTVVFGLATSVPPGMVVVVVVVPVVVVVVLVVVVVVLVCGRRRGRRPWPAAPRLAHGRRIGDHAPRP